MKVKSKKQQENNIVDILRWCALLPAICITWYFVWSLGAMVILWFLELLNSNFVFWLMVIVDAFVLPAVVNFFVVRLIAPKYKNKIAWAAVGLTLLWAVCFVYGLIHLAY